MDSFVRFGLILLCLGVCVLGHVHFEMEGIDMQKTKLHVSELKMQNLQDHYSQRHLGKFGQRYWEMLDYFDPKAPRAILYICGESTGKFPKENTLSVRAAKEAKAALYSLEHRFYGVSQPAEDWSDDNLSLLSHDQALADIAYFIESMNKKFNESSQAIPKWVVIGGSYAGALSAWARYKYPHLISGAIASSAVVNVISEFKDFEMQTGLNLQKCEGEPANWSIKQLREYQLYADSQLIGNTPDAKKAFLAMFNATDMGLLDFAYYFADIAVSYIQSSNRKLLCSILDTLRKSGKPIKDQIKQLAESAAARGFTADRYKFSSLRKTKINFDDNGRQWTYQTCSLLGWFQISYKQNPIRWTGMNFTYWMNYCHEIFDVYLLPDDVAINMHFGGKEIGRFASNTYFVHGTDDGWKWVGVLDNIHGNPDIKFTEIKCDDCSHCIDLKPELDTDADILKATRVKEIAAIIEWLA